MRVCISLLSKPCFVFLFFSFCLLLSSYMLVSSMTSLLLVIVISMPHIAGLFIWYSFYFNCLTHAATPHQFAITFAVCAHSAVHSLSLSLDRYACISFLFFFVELVIHLFIEVLSTDCGWCAAAQVNWLNLKSFYLKRFYDYGSKWNYENVKRDREKERMTEKSNI